MDFGGPDRPDCDEAQVDLLIIHMRRLGFSVELDDSMVQPTDDACGAVAALAAARMSEGDWMSADLSLAVHPNIISNAVVSWLNLGLRAGDECPRLCAYHVEMLYHFFMYIRTPGRGQNGWNGAVFSVLPLDKLCCCGGLWRKMHAPWSTMILSAWILYLLCKCVCAILRCLACQAVTGLQ